MKVVSIEYTKKAQKGRDRLNAREMEILKTLEQDLRDTAGKPYGRGWESLGVLQGTNLMHCHLTHKKVVV